jgi:hypothetical protein
VHAIATDHLVIRVDLDMQPEARVKRVRHVNEEHPVRFSVEYPTVLSTA